MKPMNVNDINSFEVVTVDNRPYMFTNMRIDRDSLPKWFVAYDVRDCDGNGEFAEIRDYVLVNHWGTIIGTAMLEMNDDFCYLPDEDKNDGCGIGYSVSDCAEFVERYDEFLAECSV